MSQVSDLNHRIVVLERERDGLREAVFAQSAVVGFSGRGDRRDCRGERAHTSEPGNEAVSFWQHDSPLDCPRNHAMHWLGGSYWVCCVCHQIYVQQASDGGEPNGS